MARYHVLAMAVALIVSACHRSGGVPHNSPEAEQLRWIDHADVQADFRDHVEGQHDLRFVSVYALSFAGEFGIPDTAEARELTRKHGSRHIEGTTDVATSSEHQRLVRKASEYARQYNALLLRYLREHPNT